MIFRIKEVREENHLTQQELSVKSGVSRNLIARLESGELKSTSTDTLFKLASALNVKVEFLFTETV